MIELRHLRLEEQASIVEYIAQIRERFPSRILAVTLFGSKARGDDDAESDIDLLVLVDVEDNHLRRELWNMASDVSMEHNVVLSARVFAQSRWTQAQRTLLPLYRAIVTEGIPLNLEGLPV
jgi:predicted nucleotidyltransferase